MKKPQRIKLDRLATSGVELKEDDLRQVNAGMAGSMVCDLRGGKWSCSGDGMND
jgi:hypothetical protein